MAWASAELEPYASSAWVCANALVMVDVHLGAVVVALGAVAVVFGAVVPEVHQAVAEVPQRQVLWADLRRGLL